MKNFIERFTENVLTAPQKTALVFMGRAMSYEQLDVLSSKIASKLLKCGAQKEKIYPIILERGFEYIASIIGVLKAGAAYSPLSSEYPKDRVEYIIKDSNADFAIDNSFIENIDSEEPLLALPQIAMHDAAIAIYTSGSTGNPKGILHDHFSFTNGITRQLKIGCTADDVQMSVTPFNFAISTQDILTSLWAGAQIHILSEEQRKDILFIDKYIDEHKITSSVISPQLLKQLPQRKSTMRIINSGGERMSGISGANAAIYNAYGLSELLSIALSYKVTQPMDNTPIGKPLDGFKAYILDENNKPVADGQEGELCIAGTMARGYINLPELTAQAFTDNPYAQGEDDKRLLHTKDICKRLPDGNIVYVNRKDWMVKINGQRVETGEVEVVLGKIKGIKTAVVKAFTDENGQTFICGYFTANRKIKDAQIRTQLAEKFPPYMIPRFIVQIESFPLTPNGKLDRKALEKPNAEDFKNEYIAPQSENEIKVCNAFESVLQIEKVGVNDDFFILGGDSIKVVMLQEKLAEMQLSSGDIFNLRTPCKIAAHRGTAFVPEYKFVKMNEYPMTDAQLGIYLENIKTPQSLEYNNPASLFFPNSMNIDCDKMKTALEKLIETYPFMKVCAKIVDGVPCVVPVPKMQYDIPVFESDISSAEQLVQNFIKPFDLEKGPLFSFALCKTTDGIYLLNDIHHLITDGTSTSLFFANLAKLYSGEELQPEDVNGFMLCTYEQEVKKTSRFEDCHKFFDNMFAGVEVDSSIIPDEFDDKPQKAGKQFTLNLADYVAQKAVEKHTKQLGITENSLFMSAFSYALAKQSGQEQALFCTIENGRHTPALRNTIGMLVHTLPICINIDENEKTSTYMSRVQNTLFDSLDHDLCSIVQLASEYEVNSDILFVYQGEMLNGITLNNEFVPYQIHKSGDAMAKLSLDVLKRKDDYTLSFEYNGNLYLEETIANFAELYINIVKGLLNCDTMSAITLCGEREKAFYRQANNNRVEFDRSLTMVDLFKKQVQANPQNTAIVFKDKKLTYKELDVLSENLAQHLVKEGVSAEVPVGIMVKRCELFPVCTLAVLKAGGVCQPLDSNYPQDRLLYMLDDSKAPVVIADDELADIITDYEGKIISAQSIYNLKSDSSIKLCAPKAENLFALIYTSGSTGKPKGCMLEHRNLVNFCLSFCKKFDITQNDRASAYGAFGFDASMQDLYPYLTAGAAVYIVPEETRLDLVGLHNFVIDNKITMMDCTTQLGRQYITAYPDSPYMKAFTVGGEKLVPCTPPNYDFVNTYGPTECTIYVTDYYIDREYVSVPIGKSFGNCDIYIVDKQGRLLPAGAVGELVISGYPVIRGYLNRPDLTAEKFINNTFFNIDGYEKMYLTGDVCRYLPDGNIQFVGRRDEQVKIRGFRIELTEIERRIRQFENVKDASVIATDLPNGGKAVVAYVVTQTQIDVPALNKFIEEKLPKYMVPSVTMQIDSIPLNPNGKVDKRKLPEPKITQKQNSAPRSLNKLEAELVKMISEITGFDGVDVSDSLVSSGLTSLTTIMFSAKLYERFGTKLSVNELMDDDCTLLTVENLIIEYLLSAEKTSTNTETKVKINDVKLCAEQLGVYYDSVKRPDALIYNIPMMYTFPSATDAQKLAKSLEKVISASPVLSSKVVLSGKDIVQQQINNFEPSVQTVTATAKQLDSICKDFVKPFDLANGPLFRTQIIKTEQNTILLFDVHHIVFDGLSFSALIRRLVDVYQNDTQPEQDTAYYEYIAEEAELESSSAGDGAREYYKQLFADFENASDITADLQGNAENGNLKESRTPVDKKAVEQFCRSNAVTPAALFLAALEYTVSRCTADKNVYISMIANGREDIKYADSFGMFVRSIPLHASINADITALDFVKATAKSMHLAIKNSSYPFIKLFDKYGFVAKINYACQLGVDEKVTLDGQTITEKVIENPLPKFNISVHIEDTEDNIIVNIQYNDALYSKKFMDTVSGAVCACVNNIIGSAQQPVTSVSLLDKNSAEQLDRFAFEPKQDIEIKLLHKMFEHQAKLVPNKTALVAADKSYTYSELDCEMNRMANSLAGLGVARGDKVAIMLPRTSRVIIAMYAVMKAGAAYIPCDPEYPQERINYIIENSGAKYIITDKPQGFKNELIAEDLLQNKNTAPVESGVQPSDTAYIIYTSGSTGRPKGVVINHGGIANYLTPYPQNIQMNAIAQDGNVMVSVTTVSFDMSFKENSGALANGLTLVLADEEQAKNPVKLVDLFDKTGGDVFNATPSRLEQYMLLPSFLEVLSCCKIVMCGGEKYSPKLLAKLQQTTKARIFNTYGPTEITVSCNAMELTNESEICVGRPLLNVNEYIVDADGNRLPVGMTGELYVGGAGVADGYLNNEEMTNKQFVTYNGERVYKTGDYAKWTSNGNVVILGRTDNQVKLRGLRIELGEVERAMLSLDGVMQAVAVIRKINESEHLCAYYVANKNITEDVLKDHISKRLTAYMVPSAFCRLDKMPQTPNGKTDVRHLPQPTAVQSREYSAPVNSEEEILCKIFANVLHCDKVGAEDSFFDLGGTSLIVTSVLVEANEQGLEVSYGDIFSLKTPRALAAALNKKEEFSDGLSDYDYSGFEDLLNNNSLANFGFEKDKTGNLLLTGATGFLGIHILNGFIKNCSGKVYCLLRGGKNGTPEQRLRAQLFYYFENDYANLFGSRINIVEGNVTDNDWFESLADTQIDTVINCAALVKHFSESDDIERINAGGVKNLIEFCKIHNSMIVQVSTESVAGDRVNNYPSKDIKLTEQMLYFGQIIDNQYVKSKFIGERYVLEAVKNGLKGKIMRVGNLAARDSDGEFQINFTTNGFMGRLRAYLAIGAFPYSAMSFPVEMAPIDETAKAILMLCNTPDTCCIFHPYNNHYVPLGDIILQMQKMGFDIALVEDDEFAEYLKKAQDDKNRAALLTTLLAYENKDSSKRVEMIAADNEYTTQVLYRLGFRWSMTSRGYMNRFLEALEGLGFFEINTEEQL